MLYRYELFFDGEQQNCGIFNGMEDVLPPETSDPLMYNFMQLIPPMDAGPGNAFLFTEKGNALAEPLIRTGFAQRIEPGSLWEIRRITVPELCIPPSYEDDLQVAYPITLLKNLFTDREWEPIN